MSAPNRSVTRVTGDAIDPSSISEREVNAMGMHPPISSELVDDLMELQVIFEDAAKDGVIDLNERRAIKSQLRLLQHQANEVDSGIRKAISYLRLNRLTPGLVRHYGGGESHDDDLDAA
jgi:hypothetical protein